MTERIAHVAQSLPWLPLYHADLLRATAHWPDEAFGAYVRLLLHQWEHGRIPSDGDELRRVAETAEKHWARLANKFPDGVNQRLEVIRAEQHARHRRLSQAGQSGAVRRWRHGEANGPANGPASGDAIQSPVASPSNRQWRLDATQNQNQNQNQKEQNTIHRSPVAPSGDPAVSVIEPDQGADPAKPRRASRSKPAYTQHDIDWAGDVYDAYPRHVGRKAAVKAILAAATKLVTTGEHPDLGTAIDWLQQQAIDFADRCRKAGTEQRFIPHPATWFNGERWDDE